MKNYVWILLLSLFSFSAFAQDEIKYTEEKAPELSKALAKVHAINSFGFKTHLFKTFVVNADFGYTKDETPEGAKQLLYISDTELSKEKEMLTKLYKTDKPLINLEILEINELPEGYEVKVAHGLNEDRIEETFTIKTTIKK
ncbi:hypothetical protein [Flavobacterium sp. XGLA_31]|uniref:hypothetical protein n=1 Tax=Flavobacterium sp. XGLA_31 TaxID=3447666 RepID=UPI003F3D7B9F